MHRHTERRILVTPEEVHFEGLEVGKLYTAVLSLHNSMSVPVEIELKPGPTVDRLYEIQPTLLRIPQRESVSVEVKLKLLRAHRTDWVIRDIIHLKSEFFDEILYVSILPHNKAEDPQSGHEKDRLQASLEAQQIEASNSQKKINRLEEEVEELNCEVNSLKTALEDKAKVEQELARVQQENTELNSALQELHRNGTYLEEVKNIFRDKAPSLENLMDLTLKQEQEKSERKNAKILEILQIKDSLIEDLEARIDEQSAALTVLQHKVTDTKVLLSNTERTHKDSVAVIEELKTVKFEKEQLVTKLQDEFEALNMKFSSSEQYQAERELSGYIEKLSIELATHKEAARDSESAVQGLASQLRKVELEAKKLKEREEYVLELTERQKRIKEEHNEVLRQKEQIITELRAKVNTQNEHIEGLLGKFSSTTHHEVLSKVIQLEEENKGLQRQLAQSHSMRQEELESVDDKQQEETRKLLEESKAQTLEIERELAAKNQEIIALQNQLIELQKTKAPDEELAGNLRESQNRLSKENEELKNIISCLEASNKELHSDISVLINKLENPEDFIHSISAQTQLVSRLNARINSLKLREEQALQAASHAEHTTNELKQQLEQGKRSSTKRQSTDTQTDGKLTQLENEWAEFEKKRFERKLAEFNKEATLYQMKHYEVLKENHDLKEKFGAKATQHIDEVSKLRREIIHLQKKAEMLEEQAAGSRGYTDEFKDEILKLTKSNEGLKKKLLENAEKSAGSLRKLENELAATHLKLAQAESSVTERTAQVAILIETMESHEDLEPRLADFTAKLCHSKAVESNLQHQVSTLQSELSAAELSKLESSKALSALRDRITILELSSSKLQKQCDLAAKQVSECKGKLAVKDHDISTLNLQLARSYEDENALKDKVNSYIQQLHLSQKRHSEVLSKERQGFKEALLKVREQSEFCAETDTQRSLVLAINQLTVSLTAASKRVSDPQVFSKIVKQMQEVLLECDSSLLKHEARIRDLEFTQSADSYFKYLDADSIESADRLVDLVELLTAETLSIKSKDERGKQDLYSARISSLERTLEERNLYINSLEDEMKGHQETTQSLKHRNSTLNDQVLAELANRKSFEKEVLRNAESEAKRKLKVRDEEIRSYFDRELSKIALDSEANRMLTLSRGLVELQLENKELKAASEAIVTENNALKTANKGLSSIIEESATREIAVTITPLDTNSSRCALQEKTNEIFKFRETIEGLKTEKDYVQQKLADSRREAHALKGLRPSEATSETDTKYRSELSELKEQHRLEVESIKTASILEVQTHKGELDQEYTLLCEKFADGEYPGEFKQQTISLSHQVDAFKKDIVRLQEENLQFNAKFESLFSHYSKVKEENESLKNIVSTLGCGHPPLPQPEEKPSLRKTKKTLTLEKHPENPRNQPIQGPQRLIRALVAAKMGESEAIRKVKSSISTQKELREALQKKEESSRTLEAKLKGVRRYLAIQGVPEPPDEFYLDPSQADDFELRRKLKELDSEVAELRLAEANAWGQFLPFSSLFSQSEERVQDEDFGVLEESVLFLAEQLADPDRELRTHHKSDTIEKSQRIVIRNLARALSRFVRGEALSGIIDFKPSREEDRQLWYVELLEGQLGNVHDTIRNLVQFINQVSVEITGNMTSSAQYKGAAMELAKTTKETSEELEVVKHLIMLIKSDLEEIRDNGQGPTEQDYRERAYLAENMKKTMEDEFVKAKLTHNYEVAELKTSLESYRSEVNRLTEHHNSLLLSKNQLQENAAVCNKTTRRLENALKEAEDRANSLQNEMRSVLLTRNSEDKKLNEAKHELRQHTTEHRETLKHQDKHTEELLRQIKSLQDEKHRILQENTTLKRHTKTYKEEVELARNRTEYDPENQQLKRKLAELTEDSKYQSEKSHKLKEEADMKVNGLEEQVALLNSALKKQHRRLKKGRSHSAGRSQTTHEKHIQEHAHNLELLSLKTEHENKAKSLNEQVWGLQQLLKEKVQACDEELRRRLEAQAELKQYESTVNTGRSVRTPDLQEKMQLYVEEKNRLSTELELKSREIAAFRDQLDGLAGSEQRLQASKKKLEQDKEEAERIHQEEALLLNTRLQELTRNSKSNQKSFQSKIKTLEHEKGLSLQQVRDLEDTLEQLAQKLDNTQKEKKQQNAKLKEYDAQFKNLTGNNDLLQRDFTEKLNGIRQELRQTYHEFKRTTDKYETQLSSLKDQLLSKHGKKQETVDYMFQISKKDALIRSLKQELKGQPKKKPKAPADFTNIEDLTLLENQIYKQKTLNKQLESQLTHTKHELEAFKSSHSQNLQTNEDFKDKDIATKREISDIEKRHKLEMTRLSEEVNRIRERWHSPEEWSNLLNSHTELENALKRSSEELARKRELIENYKALKGHQETEANVLQGEIEQIKDAAEKMKKLKAEIARKEKSLFEMKLVVEQSRDNEKRVSEDNAVLTERLKSTKNDVSRKDNLIRELKYKLETASGQLEDNRSKQDTSEKLKEQLRKLKLDYERKDTQLKTLKSRLEGTTLELENLERERTSTCTETFVSLEKETKRSERLQLQLTKTENQLQSLYQVTKRIFKDLSESVESLRKRFGQSYSLNKEHLSDCMNILNLDLNELSEFMAHGGQSSSDTLQYIERMLDKQDIDVSSMLKVFRKLLDERVELERSGSFPVQKQPEKKLKR